MKRADSMKKEEWKNLNNPENYYYGKMLPANFMCPDNILFFHRSVNKYLRNRPHTHIRYTLVFPETELTYYVDAVHFEIAPGDALLIYPFQYRFLSSHPKGYDRLYLTFTLKEKQPWLPAPGKYEMTDTAGRHLANALDFYKQNDPVALAFECTLLLRELSGQRPPERSALLSPLISASVNYMSTHISENLTVRTLADICHSSESNLRLRFKQEIGVSPGVYLANMRLNVAVQLLNFSDKTIQEISHDCGFSSVFAFSHFFKRHFKCSPLQYRKKKSPRTADCRSDRS